MVVHLAFCVQKYLRAGGLRLENSTTLHGDKPVVAVARFITQLNKRAAGEVVDNDGDDGDENINNNNDNSNNNSNDATAAGDDVAAVADDDNDSDDDDDEDDDQEEDDDGDAPSDFEKLSYAQAMHFCLINVLMHWVMNDGVVAGTLPTPPVVVVEGKRTIYKGWTKTTTLLRDGAEPETVTTLDLVTRAFAWMQLAGDAHLSTMVADVRAEYSTRGGEMFFATARDLERSLTRELAVGNLARARVAAKNLQQLDAELFFRRLHFAAAGNEPARAAAATLLAAATTALAESPKKISVLDLLRCKSGAASVAFRGHKLFAAAFKKHSADLAALLAAAVPVESNRDTVAGVAAAVEALHLELGRLTVPDLLPPWESLYLAPLVSLELLPVGVAAIHHAHFQWRFLGRILREVFRTIGDDGGTSEAYDLARLAVDVLESASTSDGIAARRWCLELLLEADLLEWATEHGKSVVSFSTNGLTLNCKTRAYVPKVEHGLAQQPIDALIRPEFAALLPLMCAATRCAVETDPILHAPVSSWGALTYAACEGDFSALQPGRVQQLVTLYLFAAGIDGKVCRVFHQYDLTFPLAHSMNVAPGDVIARHQWLVGHLWAAGHLLRVALDPGVAAPAVLVKSAAVFQKVDDMNAGAPGAGRHCLRPAKFAPFVARPHRGNIIRVAVSRLALDAAVGAQKLALVPCVGEQHGYVVASADHGVAGLQMGDQLIDLGAVRMRHSNTGVVRTMWQTTVAATAQWKRVQVRLYRAPPPAARATQPTSGRAALDAHVAYAISRGSWEKATALHESRQIALLQGRVLWADAHYDQQRARRGALAAAGDAPAELAALDDALACQADVRRLREVAAHVRMLHNTPDPEGSRPMTNAALAVCAALAVGAVVRRLFYHEGRVACLAEAARRRKRALDRLVHEVVEFATPPLLPGWTSRPPLICIGDWIATKAKRRGGTRFPFKEFLTRLGRRAIVVICSERLTSAACAFCSSYVTHPRKMSDAVDSGTTQCANTSCPMRARFIGRDVSAATAIGCLALWNLFWGGRAGWFFMSMFLVFYIGFYFIFY